MLSSQPPPPKINNCSTDLQMGKLAVGYNYGALTISVSDYLLWLDNEYLMIKDDWRGNCVFIFKVQDRGPICSEPVVLVRKC